MSRKVVELPLEQNPPIQSYQDHAFWLSILLGNDPQLLPWLTMQCTNLIWKKDNQVLSPYIYSKWRFGTEEILPMEHFFNVSPSLFSRPSFDIVAIVKDMLDQGLYQLGSFDEYYIPGKSRYQKGHFIHNNLIYGYDDGEGCFLSIGYLEGAHYKPFRVAYPDFVSSMANAQKKLLGLLFTAYAPNPVCQFEPERYRRILHDYLTSRNMDGSDNQFGIACLASLALEAEGMKTAGDRVLDIRRYRCLREHFQMTFRGLGLLEQDGIPADLARYAALVDQSSSAMMLGLKYNVSRRPEVLDRLAGLLRRLDEEERACLEPVALP